MNQRNFLLKTSRFDVIGQRKWRPLGKQKFLRKKSNRRRCFWYIIVGKTYQNEIVEELLKLVGNSWRYEAFKLADEINRGFI